MIGYLEGTLLRKAPERLLVLVNQVGYDVRVPPFVFHALADKRQGDPVSLFIHFHQTERQPAPVLIGFTSEEEKEFFLQFISVEAIGPLKAIKALTLPIEQVAAAIEAEDARTLSQLKGIGARTAQKIVATLAGKMGRFTGAPIDAVTRKRPGGGMADAVMAALVDQLGYKSAEAEALVEAALKRKGEITTEGELFDEVMRRL